MPMPYVIGITGKKRSGKDTIAARLVEHHGFTRVAFADPLKATMVDLDPIIEVQADEVGILYGPGTTGPAGHARLTMVLKAIGWERAKSLREVRRLLQAHGVAIREHADQRAWIRAAENTIRETRGPVVIPDVRFSNEAWFIEGVGDLVRVTRPGLVSDDTHVSETEMDDHYVEPHLELVNDGTVADLRAKVDQLVAHPDVAWRLPAERLF